MHRIKAALSAFLHAVRRLLPTPDPVPAELCPHCARLWERSGRASNAACWRHQDQDS